MLLKIKPGNRTNWISFAIAHHLNGSHELAVQMLDTFENNIMVVRGLASLPNLRHAVADHRFTIMLSVNASGAETVAVFFAALLMASKVKAAQQ